MIFTILIILFFILILFQKQLNKFQLINGIIIIACCLYYEQSEKFINYTCNNNSCKIYDITDLLEYEPDKNIVKEINDKLDPIKYSGADSNFIAVDIFVPYIYNFEQTEYNIDIKTHDDRLELYKIYINKFNDLWRIDLKKPTDIYYIINSETHNRYSWWNEPWSMSQVKKKTDLLKDVPMYGKSIFHEIDDASSKISFNVVNVNQPASHNKIKEFLKIYNRNILFNNTNLYFCKNGKQSSVNPKYNNIYYEKDTDDNIIFKNSKDIKINLNNKKEKIKYTIDDNIHINHKEKKVKIKDEFNVFSIDYELIDQGTNKWNDMIEAMWGSWRHRGASMNSHSDFNEGHEWNNGKFKIAEYTNQGFKTWWWHNRNNDLIKRLPKGETLNFNNTTHIPKKNKTLADIGFGNAVIGNDILVLNSTIINIKDNWQDTYIAKLTDQNTLINEPLRDQPYALLLLYESGHLQDHGHDQSIITSQHMYPVKSIKYMFDRHHGDKYYHMNYAKSFNPADGSHTDYFRSFPAELIKKHNIKTDPKKFSINFEFDEIYLNNDNNWKKHYDNIRLIQQYVNKINDKIKHVDNEITSKLSKLFSDDVMKNNIKENFKIEQTSDQFNTALHGSEKNELIKNILLNSEKNSIKTIYVSKYNSNNADNPNQIRKYVILKM